MRYVDPALLERVNAWLTPFFDDEVQQQIKEMIAYDPEGLEDSFYKTLEFGTGGMRGVMGPGDNRINKYTLGKATQGLCNYLGMVFPGEDLKVAIAYDCRHNSDTLSQIVADVFSANDIEVYRFSELRPTPELSFAVRELNCHCGIVLTASHNPPEYNGYKVYWRDGGQLVPPHDKAIIEQIEAIGYEDTRFEAKADLIHTIDEEIDAKFVRDSLVNGSLDNSEEDRAALSVVFTPLHGTSVTIVPRVLKEAGYSQLTVVREQAEPDGDFPTVESPNPEETAALQMALEEGRRQQADIVIGTDPDCDRLGIAVRNAKGDLELLNGNQAMVVLAHILLERWKEQGKLDGRQFIGSTIVSTPMLKPICEAYGVHYMEGLTGFKWIAKMVLDHPELEFIGGGEESYGFMVGDFVRDKDAVTSTLLACEAAAQLKAKGLTLTNYLEELYAEFGTYRETLTSLVKKGKQGAEEIQTIMQQLRENPAQTLGGEKVVRVEDYQHGKYKDLLTGETGTLDLPRSNVLIYFTEEGSKVAARPSGTEPKIKFYISVSSEGQGPEIDKQLDDRIIKIKTQLGI